MKRDFFIMHRQLVRQGAYAEANFLLKKVIENSRPQKIHIGLSNHIAWSKPMIQATDHNGYYIHLGY